MCGIAGVVDFQNRLPPAERTATAVRMAEALIHRGPDDQGVWDDPDAGVALSHRRLSIIELSELGHQPMVSASGRYVIVYNGEIYNFQDLRTHLEQAGDVFRGNSDTEVLLGAIERWGLKSALAYANGMFALALWDRRDRRLHLARDRFGQKPLYFGYAGGVFAFASELKACAQVPGWTREIDRGALTLYFRHGYVPEPHAIWRRLYKLRPGHIASVDSSAFAAGKIPESRPYWNLRDTAAASIASPLDDVEAATDTLESLLRDAVSRCMVSDVPLGAFLSGGIDSSLVVALMQSVSNRPINTFSIGFAEQDYNEAHHAAAVARHLGTEHHELVVTQQDARDLVPKLPRMYDEPFADSSQLPTHLVSRFARSKVTVSLSGDGGDELFGGYNRYLWGARFRRGMAAVPGAARRGLARALIAIPIGCWDRLASALPERQRVPQAGDKAHKLATIIDADSLHETYRRIASTWQRPLDVVVNGAEPDSILSSALTWPSLDGPVMQMMLCDAETYLPGDILTKVDRASMAVSLESRAPILDHRVAEFAWRLPDRMRFGDGGGKWLLREVLHRHVPRAMVERPKMGFGVPIGQWIRRDLRDWAGDHLSPDRLRRDGYLHPDPVTATWHEHQSGQRNWQHALWTALMFQAWLDEWDRPR